MGDIVCLRDEPTSPTKWPIARVIEIHPGKDVKVRVVTLRTPKGVYKRPIVKVHVVQLLQGRIQELITTGRRGVHKSMNIITKGEVSAQEYEYN